MRITLLAAPSENRGLAPGFTIVELVVTIGIVALLAAIIGPRFASRDVFAARGFYDQATETVRFAQKTSVAWRRQVFVCVTPAPASISAGLTADCTPPLTNPATGQPLATLAAPAGVTLAGANFSFTAPTAATAGGRPNPDAQITIMVNSTVAGDPVRRIVIERETGYVHN
jgi:MSHA pilin protein MshC